MNSFFMIGARQAVEDEPVATLDDVLDWRRIERQLVGLYQREVTNGGGPEPYPALAMFKAILLGQWFNLSDAELQRALRLRLDFMVFTGFEPGARVPDESTLCRFRNRLIAADLDQVLMVEINRQLEASGLKVNRAKGAIVDATIIPSAARPRTSYESAAADASNDREEGLSAEPSEASTKDNEDADESKENNDKTAVRYSADSDARWTKKHGQNHYGYRGYQVVDVADGYIEHVEVHPANEAEVNKLEGLLDHLPADSTCVLADKGYCSKANREAIKSRGLVDLVQQRAARNRPLSPEDRQMNGYISLFRWKVEQAFGTLKRRFHLSRARYFGRRKVEAQMRFGAIGLNLLKAHRKIGQLQVRCAC
jgi:IS5 family transposase